MQARSTVSLCFSLLSEIHSSRREMMSKIQGAKASELRGRSIFEPEDQDIMARIVEKQEWESNLLQSSSDRDERVSRIPSLESGYLSDIRSALDTRGCSQALIRFIMPGLPSDADSKWRCYKRYCSTTDKPLSHFE